MRIRTIKPEFWSSLTITELSVVIRLTFIGLWNYADDEGRGVYDAKLIKSAIWPRDDKVTPAKVRTYIEVMAEAGLVTVYEVHERSYLSVNGWGEHQSISKPKPSKLPAPPETSPGLVPDESSRERNREGNREQGTGKGTGVAPRERDALFEIVADVCGIDWHELTDSARGSLNKAVAQLRAIGVDPDDVAYRAGNWPYDDIPLTPPALAKHWPSLSKEPKARLMKSTVSAIKRADRLEAEGR